MKIFRWLDRWIDWYLGESAYQERQKVRSLIIKQGIEDWERKGYGEPVELTQKIVKR